MKSDLDALMQARDLDAILVMGNAMHNPPMYYLTGGGHVNDAFLIKKCGENAVIFCNPMEREEAAKSGLKVRSIIEFDEHESLKQVEEGSVLQHTLRLQMILQEFGLEEARIGIYGKTDFSHGFAVFSHLQGLLPNAQFVGEGFSNSIFVRAMETKDEAEIAHIRKMGQVTVEVVRLVAEYLTSCDVREDQVLLKEDGSPLTVGDVHSKIRLWVAERGGTLPQGFIFATGHDAGVPHSTGNPKAILRLGETILFDIYPAEAGGGYFYDFTRTWSLGYATPEAQKLYDQVKEIYHRVLENLDLNAVFKQYEVMVCEYFESKGHATKRTTPPAPLNGYVHSLGHGVGLNIHERPGSALNSALDNILKPGVVITTEPGLYYPEENMGIRIEDTVWMRPDGQTEILAEYPYDFVLPMKKWKRD
jgi:Xaa-Pro aminopeptidase